ncbi:hypothetical protein PG988_012919 [Apiospora saccharicola]
MCCGCIGCLELFLVGKLAQSLDNLLIRDQLLRITVCRLLRLLRLGISSWRGGFSGFRLSFLGGIPPPLLLAPKQQQWLVQVSPTRSSPQAFRLSAYPLADLALLGVREIQVPPLQVAPQRTVQTWFFGGGGTEGSRTARLRAFRPGASDSPAPPRPLSFAQSTHSSLFLELADPLLAVLDIPPRLFLDGVHLEFGLVLGGVHVAVELLLALLVLPGPARLELLVFLAPAPFALFVFDPPRLDDAVALRLSLPVELGPLPFVRRAQVREQRVPLLLQLIEAGVVLLDRQKRGDGLVDLRQVVVHLLH